MLWASTVYVGAALLLVAAYLFNLGSLYAPTNGDEMVYLHIARLTSESGHWLPLVSDLQTPTGSEMRNTKPPLLFWQAMLAGNWSWDLFTLRLPYVLQTLVCAVLIAWLVWMLRREGVQPLSRTLAQQALSVDGKLNGEREWREVVATPLLAAALYLGFFATYRYGRPVLSSSIESLFLFAACTLAIIKLPSWRAYPIRLAAVTGLLMIPALLAKSFVLAAPVGLWLFASLWVLNDAKPSVQKIWQSAWPAVVAVVIGVAGFALWFAVDPHPAAVWREFVVGENFSTKFSDGRSDSIPAFWLSPLVNAGLLFPLVIGLCVAALQPLWNKASQPANPMPMSEKLLWLWVLCWMLVFTLPSQRSGRYIIPVMPALAVLLAMYADRIHRFWWMLTLALVALATVPLVWIAWCLDGVFAANAGYSTFYFVTLALLLAACGLGLVQSRWRIGLTAACGVTWLALLGALAMPFDKAQGAFDAASRARVVGQAVQVPSNFNASWEKYWFALPKSNPQPNPQIEVANFVVRTCPYGAMCKFAGGEVLGERYALRSRHAAGEVTWAALSSQEGVQRLLVEREVLMTISRGTN